ncbi:MAG: 1-deoxy-D-xylulose-5-phosphate reductoisomerase [Proteobacteria bacterium]|nr:1-deoxy-D-xylulose-5-phosphate reductoisomerase [Pseudomonadota bacterium]MBU1738459.1 1-deoxy-D-xylulose-5-phosphate reductoisomerase [Pseudomonadota bacterium]
MARNISILGSTGSIGRNVLEVVRQYPGRFRVAGLAAGSNIRLLKEQIDAFDPELVSVADPALAGELIGILPEKWRSRVFSGSEGNERVACVPSADMVVSAIVGAAGLTPTLAAINGGKNIALANKETLVMAGNLVMETARRKRVHIHPVDSEHSAIDQGLDAGRREDVTHLILTASGGPFYSRPERELWDVTPEEALAHPNWSMGRKISIDSATLMNKGLEVIEAHFLFGMNIEEIEVLIHPQSIVHSMVEFLDGSVIAHLGVPDMKIPIAYALTFPERLKLPLPRLNLAKAPDLQFLAPDFKKFPALKLAYQVCKRGGTLPAALNAANEVAVNAFLDGRIRFPEISLTVSETVSRMEAGDASTLENILAADIEARVLAESVVESLHIKYSQLKGTS